MLPSTESEKRNTSWVAIPIAERRDFRSYLLTGTPSMSTSPLVTSVKRGIRLIREVLPAPVGPIMATVSPGFTVRSISSSTSVPWSLRPADLNCISPFILPLDFTASGRDTTVDFA